MADGRISANAGGVLTNFGKLRGIITGITAALILPGGESWAAGLFRDGAGGQATALGGATVAGADSPLAAMGVNPAALADLDVAVIEAGSFGAHADAHFTNAVNGRVGLSRRNGHGGEFAVATPFAGGRGTLGLSLIPEATLVGDWRFLDAPGGTDGTVSYGLRRHRSRFVAVRGGLGAAWKWTDDLAVGGSLGLVYERIDLQVPYIFQHTAGLRGFKTLLDLETDGLSWNGDLGLRWRIREDLDFGLRYRSSTSLRSEGSARGDAYAQLAAMGLSPPRTDFRYDAEVELSLPDQWSAGLAWRAREDLRLFAQIDWTPWSEHFDRMRVRLANGSNPDLGADAAVDYVPLSWDDCFSYRLGIEYQLNTCWVVRGGYMYAPNPIDGAFVTPVNGAISEHTLSAGVGYRRPGWSVDLGYQYDLRHEVSVGRSGYRAGEYSDSRLDVATHWWGLSLTKWFR